MVSCGIDKKDSERGQAKRERNRHSLVRRYNYWETSHNQQACGSIGDPVYHEAIEHPQKLIEIRGVWIVNAHNIAKEWNIGPITTEIKTPVKDNHLIIAIDKLLYRLGSIEKRLQTLEDKARADTSTQKRKDADSGDKGMDLSGFW